MSKEKCTNFICNFCNKNYKSYHSRWIHIKKFHNNDNSNNIPIISNNIPIIPKETPIKMYPCRYCKKDFTKVKTRWMHEKKCKLEDEKKKEEINTDKLKLKILEQEAEILKLKLKLEQSTKKDTVTLKQLNKRLLERANLIKNSNINSNNTNNTSQVNNITNNIQLVGFGKEDFIDLLTYKEKKLILNSKYCSLEKLIEIIHCGKYNQFKNIIITNMKDNYMYKYDEATCQFVLSNKSDVMSTLIDHRMMDLEVIYNELLEKNKLDEQTKNCVEKFINDIYNSNNKIVDYNGQEYETYRHYKINEIKVLLYNNQDKIANDISLLLTTTTDTTI